MGLIALLVLGLIAGFVASKIVDSRGQGILVDIILGIIGAFVGGFIMNAIGNVGITGFNLWSLLVATGGAIVILVIYHALIGKR
jgi:uncharacterized membrane protein YeaQ/YmgE (transglycosylase-associated protein family)